MKHFYYTLFSLVFSSTCLANETLDSTLIKRMDFLANNFSTSPTSHTQIYLVDKDVTGKERDTLVKIFVEKFVYTDLQQEHTYSLIFFKESDITNIRHLQKQPGDIHIYSGKSDLIWIYNISKRARWISISSDQYKNGNRIGGWVKLLPLK